ncbi:cytochrome P450 [Burkholderiaceae bacterium]|nr:cytochrome P450 [Burkholderiaceae bacterium]
MRTYDPTDVSLRRNPYGLLAELRETEPVHWCPPLDAWLLTRYDDVKQAMTAPQLSSDRLRPFYESLKDERRDILSGVMRYLNEWLVFKAPPDHTRLRRMMNPVISPRLVQSMRPSVRAIVDDLLAGVSRDQPFDFVHDVAALLPAYVIMDMLGLARADFHKIKGWSDGLRLFIGTARGVPDKYQRARDGADHLAAYLREQIEQRRRAPTDDVITRMMQAEDEQGKLGEDELIAMCLLILFGGHETTTSLLGSSVAALLAHPSQWTLLRDTPELMPSAVEEFLRYDGPSHSIARVVTESMTWGGQHMKAGDRVFAMVGAANRDPRAFDRPDALDITRSPNRHLTFGQGIHFCLGAPLARLEAQVCIQAMVSGFDRWALDGSEDRAIDWLDAMVMRGPTRLQMRLENTSQT